MQTALIALAAAPVPAAPVNIRQLTDVSHCNLQQHFPCNWHLTLATPFPVYPAPGTGVIGTQEVTAVADNKTVLAGWRLWHSRDGDQGGLWYATRTGQRYPDDAPEGWAMTVYGPTEGELRNAISRQEALDRLASRAAERRLRAVPAPRGSRF